MVAWRSRKNGAVRFRQNKSRHGLHFESETTHLALLREAGFERIEVREAGGLGSNALMTATKPAR